MDDKRHDALVEQVAAKLASMVEGLRLALSGPDAEDVLDQMNAALTGTPYRFERRNAPPPEDDPAGECAEAALQQLREQLRGLSPDALALMAAGLKAGRAYAERGEAGLAELGTITLPKLKLPPDKLQ